MDFSFNGETADKLTKAHHRSQRQSRLASTTNAAGGENTLCGHLTTVNYTLCSEARSDANLISQLGDYTFLS